MLALTAVAAALISQAGMMLVYHLGHTVRPVTLKSCILIAGVAFFSIIIISAFQFLFGRKGTVSLILAAFCALITIHSFIFPVNEVYFRYPSLAAILMVEFLAVPFIIGKQEREKFQISKGAAPENCFAVIAIVIGLFICICTPVSSYNCWDDETHYSRTVFSSQGIYSSFTEADIRLIYSPNPVYDIETRISDINMYDSQEHNPDRVIVMSDSKALFTDRIAYIGNVAFRWIAQLLGLSFSVKYILGRIGGLLLYTAVMYCAIRHLKSGKLLLSAIALSPTIFYISCNYSQDPWVFGFFSLGFAYFFRAIEDREKLSNRTLVIMLGSFVIACLPKMPYLVMILLLLFLPTQMFESSRQHKWFIAVTILSFVGVLVLMFASTFMVGNVADTRGGDNVNAVNQLKYIFANLPDFIKMIFDYLTRYLSPQYYSDMLTQFGTKAGPNVSLLLVLFISVVALFDGIKIPVTQRLPGVLVIICQIIALAVVMYLVFTPVGEATVFGCQRRYLLPMMFAFLMFAFGGWIKIRINKWIVYSVSTAILLFSYVSAIVLPTFY